MTTNPNPDLAAIVERARGGEIDTPGKCPVCIDARVWVLDGDRKVPLCPYCCRYQPAAQDVPPPVCPATPRDLYGILSEALFTAEQAATDYAEMYGVRADRLNPPGSPEVAGDMAAMAWFIAMLSTKLEFLAFSDDHATEAPPKPRRPSNRKARPYRSAGAEEPVVVTG